MGPSKKTLEGTIREMRREFVKNGVLPKRESIKQFSFPSHFSQLLSLPFESRRRGYTFIASFQMLPHSPPTFPHFFLILERSFALGSSTSSFNAQRKTIEVSPLLLSLVSHGCFVSSFFLFIDSNFIFKKRTGGGDGNEEVDQI